MHNSTTNTEDTSIRWMDDSDASHVQHVLIRDWEDTPGALAVYSPAILPVGNSQYSGTLIFMGETYAFSGCALFCEGLYKWVANTGGSVHGGTVTRLSPQPSGSGSISTFESDGEPTTDGHVVYDHAVGSSNPVSFTTDAYIRDLLPGSFGTAYGTECGNGDYDKNPSPSPVNPARVAYGGCDQADPFSPEALVAGQNGANKAVAGYDDQPFEDLSWNPAGTRLIDVETGADPGLWSYGPEDAIANPTKPIYYALANPGNYQFGNPRFIGTSRIVFDGYADVTDLYTIPATCADRPPNNPCTMAANATKITNGVSGSSFFSDPTWSPLTPAQLGLTPAPPNTTIATHPPSSTSSQSASFTFTATPAAGATFQCNLDAGAYAACTSPKSYSGLTRTSHTFRVRAANGAGTDATPATFTWTITGPPPTVGSFSPASGKTRTLVTIHGTNFTGATAVKLGATLASSLPMPIVGTTTATQITAYVWDYNTYYPTGKIWVTTPGGTASSAGSFNITFGISNVMPQTGPAGTNVTISGVGFSPTATVKFNTVAAAQIVSRSGSTSIVAKVPNNSAATGKVTVTNTTGVIGTVTSWWTFTKT